MLHLQEIPRVNMPPSPFLKPLFLRGWGKEDFPKGRIKKDKMGGFRSG